MDDLRLKSLTLCNFRNYEMFHVEHFSPLTIFVGPNAIGKTNIIEAIELVTSLHSFRNPKVDELIHWGSDCGQVQCNVSSLTRDLDISLCLKDNQRKYCLNGKHKTATDLQGLLPSVIFSPEDLTLVKGSQTLRRQVLDSLGCQLSRNHRIIKRDYEKIVRHKNALLKQGVNELLLESVNDMLVQTGVQLYRYRIALFENMINRIQDAYARIAGVSECVSLSYIPSWENSKVKEYGFSHPYCPDYDLLTAETHMRQMLEQRSQEERIRQRCVVGPHADKIAFFIQDRNASLYGSQGQQRSLVLAWKVAEVGIISDLLEVKPILLLDDVMSELDHSRRQSMVSLLFEDIQTFITTTDTAYFDDEVLERGCVMQLQGDHHEVD